MSRTWVFDQPHTREITEARRSFLERFVRSGALGEGTRTALDAGAGVGELAAAMARMGLRVTAFDGRAENVAEGRRRHPGIDFREMDAEDPAVASLGRFDLVLCYGLLYHLENPFRALRNLAATVGGALVLESVVIPEPGPKALLVEEGQGEDQGLRYFAFLPSERAIAMMLRASGLPHVYRAEPLPDHEQFRTALTRPRRRTILVASRAPLRWSGLRPLEETVPEFGPLARAWWWVAGRIAGLGAKGGRSFATRVIGRLRHIRAVYLHRIPVPVRLPWGAWWFLAGDTVSYHVAMRDGFERGEQALLLRLLRPGMTVLDVGAHHGLYTLLASRKVGPDGSVIAFEPSPRERRRLVRNLEFNRCGNVRVADVALGSEPGTATLYVCVDREWGCNSLRPPDAPDRTEPVTVPVKTLDGFLAENGTGRVDFLKMDVEGGERDVLRGAEGLLRGPGRPMVLAEVADIRTRPWGYPAREIYDHLATRGYRWFTVTPEGALRSCPRRDEFHDNLLAVPEERLDAVAGLVEDGGGS